MASPEVAQAAPAAAVAVAAAEAAQAAKQTAQAAAAASAATVICLSGCRDDQKSVDLQGPSGGGACTRALQAVLDEWGAQPPRGDGAGDGGAAACSGAAGGGGLAGLTWAKLLHGLGRHLQKRGFQQVPQLCSTKQLDLHSPFTLCASGAPCRVSGRRRALLVGINYVGQSAELDGCHTDMDITAGLLMAHFGFAAGDLQLLADDGRRKEPTAENLVKGLRWLVDGAKEGDALFFSFSGHGVQVPERVKGTEEDGMDEALVSSDLKVIVDDDLFSLLVRPLPQGARLTCLIDTCHSGTVLDLPYTFAAGQDSAGEITTAKVNFDEKSSLGNLVSGFTGKAEYEFGSISSEVLRRSKGLVSHGLQVLRGLFSSSGS